MEHFVYCTSRRKMDDKRIHPSRSVLDDIGYHRIYIRLVSEKIIVSEVSVTLSDVSWGG